MSTIAMDDPSPLPLPLGPTGTAVKVLCCMCGVPIPPNPSNACASCLASKADVTRGISTEATLHQCRGCRRWHKDGATKWIGCELESRELMALCLSKVSGLKTSSANSHGERTRLVDAGWIWTEPHSMRLKVRLTIQKEVNGSGGTILQQSFVVTFVVRNQQCIECQAEFRQGSWKSLVQVRQRVDHKRTFLYLEQLILKHGAHRGCLSIETFRDGMDFYFPDKGKAARFVSFLENVVPIKVKSSKKLIGTDDKSNIANFKYTNLVEICPLCKDDLLYLPKKIANRMGDVSRLVLVKNVSNVIRVVDPLTGRTGVMNPEFFWRDPFRPVVTAARSRLTRYVVLGKEPVILSTAAAAHRGEGGAGGKGDLSKGRHQRRRRRGSDGGSVNGGGHGGGGGKKRTMSEAGEMSPLPKRDVGAGGKSKTKTSRLASVTLARERDLGSNDALFEGVRSHLGYLLKSGDVCVGYDLTELQLVVDDDDVDTDGLRSNGTLPDVVVVRKLYGGAAAAATDRGEEGVDDAVVAAKKRLFRLQRMDVDVTHGAAAGSSSRKAKKKADVDMDDADEEDFLQEVEADREMRGNINLYRSDHVSALKKKEAQEGMRWKKGEDVLANDADRSDNGDEDDDDDDQQVHLDELLDGLALEGGPDDGNVGGGVDNGNGDDDDGDMAGTLEEGEKAAKDGISYIGRDDARKYGTGNKGAKESAMPVSGNAFGKEFIGKDFKFI